MRGFKVGEELFGWAHFALSCVLQALTDALLGIGAGGDVEQVLIRLGVLYDGRCLPLYGEHHGALGFLELFHEVA